MKILIGLVLVIVGIACGIYFGLWWALIGGIIPLINDCRVATIVPMDIALDVVRILFAGAIGWLTAMFPIGIGIALIKE